MKKKNLYLMCGAPGSGKTTYLCKHADGPVVSRDAIRFSLVSEDEKYFSKETEVFNTYIKYIQMFLDDNSIENIYCDATQLTEAARNKVLDRLIIPEETTIYAVVIRPDIKTVLARNAQRTGRAFVPESAVRRMYNSYTDPAKDKKYKIIPIYAEITEQEEPVVEKKIFITSDTHINHNREFIYKPRGFNSIEEMNEAIVERWNAVVGPDDEVYLLGDVMLGDSASGVEYVKRLNGAIHIVLGNHDTDPRINLYYSLPNVVEVALAAKLKYKKHHFFMTHYPCLTGNLEKESLTQMTLNLYGHTHQKTNFLEDRPYCYHVGMDSHNCTPVLLDDIIKEMYEKVEECKEYL